MATNNEYSVEFNDSLLDLDGWKKPRYEGSKLTSDFINIYNEGDITYGKNPVITRKIDVLYLGNAILGEDEDESILTIPNHSYVTINKLLLIDKDKRSITFVRKDNTNTNAFERFVTNNLQLGSKIHIELIDITTQHKLQKNHFIRFNRGFLNKFFSWQKPTSHTASTSNENPAQDGVFFGIITGSNNSSGSYAGSRTTGGAEFGDPVFHYAYRAAKASAGSKNITPLRGDHAAFFSTVPPGGYQNTSFNKNNPLYQKIYPPGNPGDGSSRFKGIAFEITQSVDDFTTFVNSKMGPEANKGNFDVFVTMGLRSNNSHYVTSSFDIKEGKNTITGKKIPFVPFEGVNAINTVELDFRNYPISGGSSFNNGLTDAEDIDEFIDDLIRVVHPIIPIKRTGPFTLDKSIINPRQIAFTGSRKNHPAGTLSTAGGAGSYTASVFTDFRSGSNGYTISTLETDGSTIITNIDKETELPDGLGEKGFVIMPENISIEISDNLEFYLEKAGLIDKTTNALSPDRGR